RLGEMGGVAVDADLIDQRAVDAAEKLDRPGPQRGGYETVAAEPALLDQVENQVRLAQQPAGAQRPVTAERGGAAQALELHAGPLQRARRVGRGRRQHRRIVAMPPAPLLVARPASPLSRELPPPPADNTESA